MDNVCIICVDVAFAGAGALQNALDCNIAIAQTEEKGYSKLLTKEPFNFDNIPEADHYIFAGAGVLSRVRSENLTGRKTILITDSHYLQFTEEYDKIIERENMEVFCMADLWKFCKHEKKMYIHPLVGIPKPQDKYPIYTICHSPYQKVFTNQKGSRQIEWATNSLKLSFQLDYICITDKSWEETLEIKAKSHFFIDQLSTGNYYPQVNYQGGLGKSGLEGMLLKCLTFSSGDLKVKSDIPPPPYVMCNSESELFEQLYYYFEKGAKRRKLIEKQYKWAKKYTDPKLVAKRILE